jgi:type II secretory pathway pseudopilin PulG
VPRVRHAFTLFEVLLVLILLVIIGSLIMPLFEGAFTSVRLRRATDQLLASWSETRSRAIESGQVQQFRYQPESGNYRSEPWYPEEVAPAVAEPIEPVEDISLPQEIVFAEGDITTFDPAMGSQLASLGQGGSGVWSSPILFFPDGSTSAATVLLRNDRRILQRATLRALTGTGRASDLLSEDEAQRYKFR